MNANRFHRRGLLLVIVLAVIVIMGGLLTLLATYAAQNYRSWQADTSRRVAVSITESAAGYAQAHRKEWSEKMPEQTIDLDVAALIPEGLAGGASIAFADENGKRLCRITGHAELGPGGATREIVLPLN